MKQLLTIVFIGLVFIPAIFFSQSNEKRLALVIGNSNYDKGALKNPVNDASLMKQTLEKLNFEVIYATNVSKKMEMLDKIAEFGRKREAYNVGFVYYAGHGVQVDGENYLLPTKESFKSEYDVQDYGVSVQKIMRYLTGKSDQVNVLILDACRDNPFESNWNSSRSLKGSGLAKIPPPTGSLIAFSTSANTTAMDGDGKNSVYCESLAKNLQLENTSIDQVFRNVRSDVIRTSNGKQIPEEASKLIGTAFYLLKTEKMSLAEKLESLEGNELTSFLENYLKERNIDKEKIEKVVLNQDSSLAINNNQNENLSAEDYFVLGYEANEKENYPLSIEYYNKAIRTDPNYDDEYTNNNRGHSYYELKMYNEAIVDFTRAITINPDIAIFWSNRALAYDRLGNYIKAKKDYTTAIKIEPNNAELYINRAGVYGRSGNPKDAMADYTKGIRIDPNYASAYVGRGVAKLILKLDYCGDFKTACDLGLCNGYNEYCK